MNYSNMTYDKLFQIFVLFLVILSPDLSFAGTGGEELQSIYDKLIGVAQGYGGKTIAVTSFILSMIAAVRGNLMAFGSAFGVGLITGVGPHLVTGGISALI